MRLALALIVAAAAAPAVAADPSLGRLFFTPTQRASLDIARSQRTRVTVATERIEELAQPVPQTITYGGMVRRSDGRTTVWLNDRAVDDQKPSGGPTIVRRVRPDGAVTLEVPQSNRRVELKVGQSVEVLSGSVQEGYRREPRSTADKGDDKAAQDRGAENRQTENAPAGGEDARQSSSADVRAIPEDARAGTVGSR